MVFNYEGLYYKEESTNYSEVYVDGVLVQAIQINSTDYCVHRVISTNPMDYLNPRLQPGSIIQL